MKKKVIKELGEIEIGERACGVHGKEKLSMVLRETKEIEDDGSDTEEGAGTSVGYSRRYADNYEFVFGQGQKTDKPIN